MDGSGSGAFRTLLRGCQVLLALESGRSLDGKGKSVVPLGVEVGSCERSKLRDGGVGATPLDEVVVPEAVERRLAHTAVAPARARDSMDACDRATERNWVSSREFGFPMPFATAARDTVHIGLGRQLDLACENFVRALATARAANRLELRQVGLERLRLAVGGAERTHICEKAPSAGPPKGTHEPAMRPKPRTLGVLDGDVDAGAVASADEMNEKIKKSFTSLNSIRSALHVARRDRVVGTGHRGPHSPHKPVPHPIENSALHGWVAKIMSGSAVGIDGRGDPKPCFVTSCRKTPAPREQLENGGT